MTLRELVSKLDPDTYLELFEEDNSCTSLKWGGLASDLMRQMQCPNFKYTNVEVPDQSIIIDRCGGGPSMYIVFDSKLL